MEQNNSYNYNASLEQIIPSSVIDELKYQGQDQSFDILMKHQYFIQLGEEFVSLSSTLRTHETANGESSRGIQSVNQC